MSAVLMLLWSKKKLLIIICFVCLGDIIYVTAALGINETFPVTVEIINEQNFAIFAGICP